MHLWDSLIDHAVITLNLLRTSSINNRLSAYAQIHGAFDFNTTPIGPPGTKVLVHNKPNVRGTWSPHGEEGWYIGPAMDHYRNFKVYIPSTRSIRISDTLAWFPAHVTMPTASSTDLAMAAAYDLTQALLNPAPASALSPLSDSQRNALIQLSTIFGNYTSSYINKDEIVRPSEDLADPRVEMTEPRMERTEPRVEMTEPRMVTIEPRMEATEPRVRVIEHVSMPTDSKTEAQGYVPSILPDSVEEVQADGEISYTSYNHNGAQRRRKAKHNRRHRNPIISSSIHEAVVTDTSPVNNQMQQDDIQSRDYQLEGELMQESKNTHQKVQFIDTPEIIPTSTPRRRSSRGKKIVRFDPRTYQMIHFAHAITTQQTNHYAYATHEPSLRQLLQSTDAEKWMRATTLELGRLTQGIPGIVEGTDTMLFIKHDDKPKDRLSSYCRVVCAYNPNKADPYRVRFTYSGDKSDYPYETSTPTVDISTVKLHLNSVISTPGARYMTLDLKNFYLNTPLERFEYMRIPISIFPEPIINQYNLLPLVTNGHVMVEIRKGIYGLPQAGILANKLLNERLLAGGYYPAQYTPGLYLHKTRKISFTLWVDDFGIKYGSRDDVDDLITLLGKQYEMTIDWSGTKYIGLTLRWNYKKGIVDLSMPGYIQRALQRFQHPQPTRPQHSPHPWTGPTFGTRSQQIPEVIESPPVDTNQVKRLQEIIGTLLYYARMVDNTMLVALGTLASAQSKATEETIKAATHLLNYCATHPSATIRFTKSDMILHIVSDASYLTASGARSRLGGYFFMSHNLLKTPPDPNDPAPTFNGPILVNSSIIQPVLSSAAEAELGALFYNAKDGCMLRNTLTDMGHPQPATPIQADNACAVGLANDTMKQKRSKAIDMRFYWVRDKVKDSTFVIYWRKGAENNADYFTKHHAPSHHRKLRARYLQVDELDQCEEDT